MKKDRRAALHYFGTNSGKCASYTQTHPGQITPADIVVSLSRQPRGIGHDPLSIAQHSLVTAFLILDFLGSLPAKEHPFAALYALLHDAAEAYTGDLPNPFKTTLRDLWHDAALQASLSAVKNYHETIFAAPFTKEIERRVRRKISAQLAKDKIDPFGQIEANLDSAIREAFGLPKPSTEMLALIKRCDKDAIALEMRDIMSKPRVKTFLASGYKFPEPRADICLKSTSSQEAKVNFLKALKLLTRAAKLEPDVFEKRLPAIKQSLFTLSGLHPARKNPRPAARAAHKTAQP